MKFSKILILIGLISVLNFSCSTSNNVIKYSHTFNLSDYKINHRKKVTEIKIDYLSLDSTSIKNMIGLIDKSKTDSLRNMLMSSYLNNILVGRRFIPNIYGAGLVSLIIGASMEELNLLMTLPQYVTLPIIELPILLYGTYAIYFRIKYNNQIKKLSKNIPEVIGLKIVSLPVKFTKKSKSRIR